MLDQETYNEMKRLIALHENPVVDKEEKPYLVTFSVEQFNKYNPNYGDNRECKCGHPYYRHFDTYEEMATVGCKYCQCFNFKEKIKKIK